jgi:hypothetical protein
MLINVLDDWVGNKDVCKGKWHEKKKIKVSMTPSVTNTAPYMVGSWSHHGIPASWFEWTA